MKAYNYLVVFLSIICYILFKYFAKKTFELCDFEKCPFCYGEDLCESFKNNEITLQSDNFIDFFYNFISVKNVYFAKFNGKNIVLKKLAHTSELISFDNKVKQRKSLIVTKSELLEALQFNSNEYKNFKTCNSETSELFLKYIKNKSAQNVLTILTLNPEPILLDVFSYDKNWPVPKLYGYCGRLAVEENCGVPLTKIQNYDWFDRAYVAYQLLKAAENFTDGHRDCRLYLTDVSPDNIVVDSDLRVSFVDLGNAVLLRKNETVLNRHYTTHSKNEDYSFSESELCEADISDHNIYAVCWLLLSVNAPWPMMEKGLLHSHPEVILENHINLLKDIELCVSSADKYSRFTLSDKIVKSLEKILITYVWNNNN